MFLRLCAGGGNGYAGRRFVSSRVQQRKRSGSLNYSLADDPTVPIAASAMVCPRRSRTARAHLGPGPNPAASRRRTTCHHPQTFLEALREGFDPPARRRPLGLPTSPCGRDRPAQSVRGPTQRPPQELCRTESEANTPCRPDCRDPYWYPRQAQLGRERLYRACASCSSATASSAAAACAAGG
jgi:hypothetical protein